MVDHSWSGLCCECVRCISGVVCDLASTLIKYEIRNGDLSENHKNVNI